MPAGLGGAGYVALVLETVKGTYLDPSTAGAVFIPILDESLQYTEDKYYSSQIRQQVVVSEAKQSYYHTEGDITLEADPNFLPYLLHCSRHNIVKAGAGPYTYGYTPSIAGATSTAATGLVQRTCSLTVVRNGIGFGYSGCTLGGYDWTIEDGTLRLIAHIVGEAEATPAALGTPAWAAANLYGAAEHALFVDAAGLAPAFATASDDFNGFTFRADHNAEAQNRIRTSRSPSYVSFGETEANYETELDFINKTEYDNFKALTKRSIQLRSLHGGSTLAAATDGVQITVYNSVYDSYEVGLGGMGDLIMAGVNGRSIGIAGGSPYKIEVKSAANIL